MAFSRAHCEEWQGDPTGEWIKEGSVGPQRLQRPLAVEFRQGVVATDGLAIDEDLGEAGAAAALFV